MCAVRCINTSVVVMGGEKKDRVVAFDVIDILCSVIC